MMTALRKRTEPISTDVFLRGRFCHGIYSGCCTVANARCMPCERIVEAIEKARDAAVAKEMKRKECDARS